MQDEYAKGAVAVAVDEREEGCCGSAGACLNELLHQRIARFFAEFRASFGCCINRSRSGSGGGGGGGGG